MSRLGFDGEGFCAVVVCSVAAGGAVAVSAGGVVVLLGGVVVCSCGAGCVTVGACACGAGTAGFFFLHPPVPRTANASARMIKGE